MIKVFDTSITDKNIVYWLRLFINGRQKELLELEKFYDGTISVGKVVKGKNRINNDVRINFAYMITKNATDYFIGRPATYSYSKGFKQGQYIDDLRFDNIEEAENKKLARDCSKFGIAYELVNIKDDKTLYFKRLNPISTFDIFDTSILEKRIATITYTVNLNKNKQTIISGYVYTDEKIHSFSGTSYGLLKIVDEQPNVFKKIPVVYYENNSDKTGDYERVTDLIKAYNKLMSCATDDYESISNAILMIKDSKKINDDEKASLNSTRVVQLFSENAEMAFINKTLDSDFVKTLREALRQDILTVCNVPDFTDEKFAGNQSGVALQYKLLGFENLRADKEIYFKQALYRRWQLVSLYPAKSFDLKRNDINITMYANLPTNLDQDVKIIELYNAGGISRSTMLENLQLVDDVEEEEKRLDEEKSKNNNFAQNEELPTPDLRV